MTLDKRLNASCFYTKTKADMTAKKEHLCATGRIHGVGTLKTAIFKKVFFFFRRLLSTVNSYGVKVINVVEV